MGFDALAAARVNEAEKEQQKKKYDDFIEQINTYYTDNRLPNMASPDMKYALSMQKKRFKEKNVTIRHKFTKYEEPGKAGMDFGSRRFDSDKYHTYYNFHVVKHEAEYRKDGKLIGRMKDNRSLLYQYSVYRNEEQNLSENDRMCCPNCGAINRISDLMRGCQYCGTRFTMSAIFPVIICYFYNTRKTVGIAGRLMRHRRTTG